MEKRARDEAKVEDVTPAKKPRKEKKETKEKKGKNMDKNGETKTTKPKRKREVPKDKPAEIDKGVTAGFLMPSGDVNDALKEKMKKKPRKFY